MATFTSPCTKEMLSKMDTAPMPVLITSTYQSDYISPKDRRKLKTTDLPAVLPENAGTRLMPTLYEDFYRNCISASIGEKLHLQFQDDTPEWKLKCRIAADRNWLHPICERENYMKTQQWQLRKMTDV